jgi:hypothetical protein
VLPSPSLPLWHCESSNDFAWALRPPVKLSWFVRITMSFAGTQHLGQCRHLRSGKTLHRR